MPLRMLLRRFYRRRLNRSVAEWDEATLGASAVVFAPHPDDETLGCGGAVILKKQVGARVVLAFMTDGRTSHAHLMPADELIAIRADEARAAGQALGADEIHLLGFPDGSLAAHHADAVRSVAAILEKEAPAQVFTPYRGDGPADHEATTAIVDEALGRTGSQADIFEYPIWIWQHWPWVPLPLEARRETLRVLKRTLQAGAGVRVLRRLNSGVRVNGVLEQKRAALAEHRTQTARRNDDPRWPTLSDVSGGAFLECFFQEREMFRRRAGV